MQQGLSQAHIEQVHDYRASGLFTARERLALQYADGVTLSDADVDERLFEAVKAEFSTPAAIVELTAIIAFENFRSKFNHALRVESNGVCLARQGQSRSAGD